MKTAIENALDKPGAKYFIFTQWFLSIVTIISILALILSTVSSFKQYNNIFITIEILTLIVFIVEYIARIWTSQNKKHYIFSFWGAIDLLSILPSLLIGLNPTYLKSVRELRIIRMLRIIRLAKIPRAYLVSEENKTSPSDRATESIVIYFIALLSIDIIFASMLYAFDSNVHQYSNIPLAMIESSKILLGGLGQATPSSLAGELIIIVERFVGLAMFGVLIAIIGSTLKKWLFGDSKQ